MRVAIIGCGAAGGWLAWQLAQRGEQVTVIEGKARPGGKACSGLVSERIWELVPRKEELIENRIEKVAIHFPRKTVTAKFRPRMLALNRYELDNWLARLAAEAGAELRFGSVFSELRETGDSVVVAAGGKKEKFDRVVGCDGARSRVRAAFSDVEPRYRAGIQCFQPVKSASRVADVWPTRHGFFWKIPRGDRIEWGLFERQERAGAMWKRFAAERRLSNLPVKAAVIPEGVLTTGSARVAMCGDAAGLTKPWSGGGILWGMISAKMLADSWPDFSNYSRTMRQHFSRKMAVGRAGTGIVTGLGATVPWLIPQHASFDSDWLL